MKLHQFRCIPTLISHKYVKQVWKDDRAGVQDVHAHAHVHPPPARNSLGEGRGGIKQPSGFCGMHVGLRLGRVLGRIPLARARIVPKTSVWSAPYFTWRMVPQRVALALRQPRAGSRAGERL